MSTVEEQFDRGNPSNVGALMQLSELGKGLKLTPRLESVTVTSHVGALSQPAAAILACYAKAGTSTGYKLPVETDSTPGAGEVAVDPDGNAIFAAADAVTSALVIYVPWEGELFTESVPVTAAGLATLAQSREAVQLVAAALDTGGGVATPGDKDVIARGTAAPGAGNAALNDVGTGVQFDATEAGTGGNATVSYLAHPGVGHGVSDAFHDRLEADYE